MILTIFITIWLLSALYFAGTFFAYLQGEYPLINSPDKKASDLKMGILFGLLFGPIGVVVALITSGFNKHGWRLR